MEWLFFYLGIGLIDWAFDGAICHVSGRKFKVWGSFLCCLFWPITALIAVFGAAASTKDFPEWKNDRKR